MDNLLGDKEETDGRGVSRLLHLDPNSPEYTQAKNERIERRRARIAAKVAKEKGDRSEATKTPSSLEFLSLHNSAAREGKHGKRSSKGTSESRKESEFGADNSPQPLEMADPQMGAQLEDSRVQLEQIITDGEALITNVKVAAEYREKVRHVRLDESRKERLQRLHDEANESKEMYEKINESWMASAEKLLPLELYAKIQEQQKACDDLLEKQDEEIYNLKKEVEDQDIEYENNLEMYQKDILLMGDRIDDTVDTLRSAFMEELDLIEQYTVQDREQLLEDNQKEFLGMLKEYEKLEKNALESRKNDALGKFDRLTDLYGGVKQEARLLKNQMQHDMRTLFMEREQIKCAIQLNLEKLDYNLSVLRKREEENMKMKNSMKRLLLKLQDRFNEKATTLREKVAKGKRDSNKLISDIRRLEILCDEAKGKTLHLYAADYHKFMDLWEFNEEECMDKLCRLLGSERYIIEEQLGTKFVQPDLSRLELRPKEVACHRERTLCCQTDKKNSVHYAQTATEIPSFVEQSNGRFAEMDGPSRSKFELGTPGGGDIIEPSMSSIFAFHSKVDTKADAKSSPSLFVDPGSDFDLCNQSEPDPELLRNLMKHISRVICDQTGFLLEDKLRRLLLPMMNSEKKLVHIDTVLQALNVSHIDQMQYLARYILKYSRIMKGIVSRNDLTVPDPGRMVLSDDVIPGQTQAAPAPCTQLGCTLNEPQANIERLQEEQRLSSTESDEDSRAISLPPSVAEMLSDTALENIKAITEVHGVPGTEPESQLAIAANKSAGTNGTKSEGVEEEESILEIIQQFSSDESLAGVLRQVENYNESAKDNTGEASSSSCSCETIVDVSDSTTTLKDSSSQPEDPFGSNKATVQSWVTEVAAGLTSVCQPRTDEYYGEVDDCVEEVDKVGNVVSRAKSEESKRVVPLTGPVSQEFPRRTKLTPARSSCGPSERSQMMTAVSPDSVDDSTEFFFVEPNDVLRALAAFCRDHHAKIKVKIPTKAEICEAKIARMCLPDKESVKDYWDRFIRLADPKSKFLWEGVQTVFTEYDQNLKVRNQFVEDIVKLYRQNYELSHLLKKHIHLAQQTCITKNQIGPMDPSRLPFCGEAKPNRRSPQDEELIRYTPCSPPKASQAKEDLFYNLYE